MIIGGVVLVLGVNRKDEKEIKNVLKWTYKRNGLPPFDIYTFT
jgi:hypothetical protein